MRAFYNEIDRYCCDWLQRLMDAGHITPGVICDKSIVDLSPDEVRGFDRVHFFAGIAGWDYALNLAGWDRPVWTGSCPCQPFSAAGKQRGSDDERHLWPAFFRLIRECSPGVVFGEQVAGAAGLAWLDHVCADLEGAGYAAAAADLPACSVGAPHRRQRLWWVAQSNEVERGSWGPVRAREARGWAHVELAGSGTDGAAVAYAEARGQRIDGRASWATGHAALSDAARGLAYFDVSEQGRGELGLHAPHGNDLRSARVSECADGGDGLAVAREGGRAVECASRLHADGQPGNDAARCGTHGMDDAERTRLEGHRADQAESGRIGTPRSVAEAGGLDPWSDLEWLACSDGKARPVKSVVQQMVDGLPESLGRLRPDQIQSIEAEIANATGQGDPGNALLDVWRSLAAQTIQRPGGGLRGVQEAPLLLAFLRQLSDQGWAFAQSLPRPGEEAAEGGMRVLWWQVPLARSPHQRGLDGQPPGEPSNAVRVLSSVLARHAQAAWGEAFDANARDAFPLAHGVPGRVGRLRAYGNAIVPWVAAEFINAVREAIT